MKRSHVHSALVASILALLVSISACSRGAQSSTTLRREPVYSPSPEVSPQPKDSVDHFLREVFEPLYDWERGSLTRAWKKIPHHENYELVQSEYGEVAGTHGLALIVMDKSLTVSKRSSLIVFIQHAGTRYDPYWIYTNENLSRVTLGRSSGDIMVSGLREDGSSLGCEISWSRKENRWTCIGF